MRVSNLQIDGMMYKYVLMYDQSAHFVFRTALLAVLGDRKTYGVEVRTMARDLCHKLAIDIPIEDKATDDLPPYEERTP